jgi:hypothetical protein
MDEDDRIVHDGLAGRGATAIRATGDIRPLEAVAAVAVGGQPVTKVGGKPVRGIRGALGVKGKRDKGQDESGENASAHAGILLNSSIGQLLTDWSVC